MRVVEVGGTYLQTLYPIRALLPEHVTSSTYEVQGSTTTHNDITQFCTYPPFAFLTLSSAYYPTAVNGFTDFRQVSKAEDLACRETRHPCSLQPTPRHPSVE